MRASVVGLTTVSLGAASILLAAPTQAATPAVGQCFTYSKSDAAKAMSPDAVDCATSHTAETYLVGTAKGGFKLPSKAKPAQLLAEAGPCTDKKLNAYLGLSQRVLPSRFQSVVILPSDQQWQAGERWMRCDVVLQGGTSLVKYKGTAPDLVAKSDSTQFDFCTPREPNARNTSAYPCNKPKRNWIMVLSEELGGPGSRFPGSGSVENRTRKICEKQGKVWDAGLKWPAWWAIWPTSTGWKEGRRSALCFVPYAQYLKELKQRAPKPTPAPTPTETPAPTA